MTLQDGTCIESYSINVKLLHNKLHKLVAKDIEEASPVSPKALGFSPFFFR